MGSIKATRRGLAALAIMVVTMLVACMLASCAPSGSAEVKGEEKSAAKTVLKAASNVLASTDSLGSSVQTGTMTISQGDERFKAFFDELAAYKGVSELSLADCKLTVLVTNVSASTAREDSQQSDYRYSITGAEMTIDGKRIAYDSNSGFSR